MYTSDQLEKNTNYIMSYLYGDDWKNNPVKQDWDDPSINLDAPHNENSNEITDEIVDTIIKNTERFYSNEMFVYLVNESGTWSLRQTIKTDKTIDNGIVFRANKSLFSLIRYKFNNKTSFELTKEQIETFEELSYLFDDLYEIEQKNKDKYDPEYIDWVLYGGGWKQHLKEESDDHVTEIIYHIFKGD